ncbi:hypothetical protein ACHAWO_006343 [Cyclotella atomus]|uniref:Uncharacterized protein n=1 Tax=Cyclotella atomus TaxID=382360 RepID=A0ABD3NMJ3_9STRA
MQLNTPSLNCGKYLEYDCEANDNVIMSTEVCLPESTQSPSMSAAPSSSPSAYPSSMCSSPSVAPSISAQPSHSPSITPSESPTPVSSAVPSADPSTHSSLRSMKPSNFPSLSSTPSISEAPTMVSTTDWKQIGPDIDGQAPGDQSGKSVAISADGNTVAIGSPNHKVGSYTNRGQCRAYRFNGTVWNQLGSDLNGSYNGEQLGWSVALSADASVVAIGSPMYYSKKGRVQVYNWNGSSWSQVGGYITGGSTYDNSGQSIALSSNGNVVAIGSPGRGGTDIGTVRVFLWNGASWSKLGGDIDGDDKYGFAGSSVAVSSIGSPGSDGNKRAGSVGLGTYLATAADEFGCSVSLSSDGKTLAVGARNSGILSGSVTVYSFDTGNWTQVGDALEGPPFERAGSSVSLSWDGKTVTVGSPYSNPNGPWSGHVGIYHWDVSTWTEVGSQIPGEASNDYSGTAISLSYDGSKIAIGALGNHGSKIYPSGNTLVMQ